MSFIFLVAFVFLNMMIGIVIQNLQAEHEKFEKGEIENAPEIVSTPSPVLSPGIETRLANIEAHLERLSEALCTPERHKA